jgi:hypothetical protein
MHSWLALVLALPALCDASCTIHSELGCYNDSAAGTGAPRVLTGFQYNIDDKTRMTREICMGACNDRGYKYAGLEDGFQCFCGDTFNPALKPLASGCDVPCDGNLGQKCGGSWQMLVLNYTCTGVPSGGAPMAIMTPCQNENVDDFKWEWEWDDLINPDVGSSICMEGWNGHCLAAEATHEHARLVITRNPDTWFYNATKTLGLPNFIALMPEKKFHIAINCAFGEGCMHDGASLLVSKPSVPEGKETQLLVLQGDTPPYTQQIGFIESVVSQQQNQKHQCLSMSCFERGKGYANEGGNCAIWQDVPDAQACQMACQGMQSECTQSSGSKPHFCLSV